MGIKNNGDFLKALLVVHFSKICRFLRTFNSYQMWPRQESNLYLELRKLLYYPLYYEAFYRLFYQPADITTENFYGDGQ